MMQGGDALVDYVVEYLSECPALIDERINVNYLDGDVPACSLDSVACQPVLKRYADGGALCEKRFALSVRFETTKSVSRNLTGARRCEEIERWIFEQVKEGRLPFLGEGVVPVKLDLIKNFGITHANDATVRFESILSLVYYADGEE